jgi:hypothetical protein
MKKLNRALSIILVVTMALCLFAVSAYADDDATGPSSGGESSTVTTDVPGDGTGETLGGTDPTTTDPAATDDSTTGGGTNGAGGTDGNETNVGGTDPAETPTETPAATDPAETDDSYKAITSLEVTKNLVTENIGAALPLEDFYIQMVPANDLTGNEKYPNDNLTSAVKIEAGPKLANSVLEFEFSSADEKEEYSDDDEDADTDVATNAGVVTKKENFEFSFVGDDGNPTALNHTGIYRYYITEVIKPTAGENDPVDDDGDVVDENGNKVYTNVPAQSDEGSYYLKYDHKQYVVDLFVNPVDGKYVVTNVLIKEDSNDAKPTSISFTNYIHCSNIKISKEITKSTIEYSADEEYTFYILIPKGGDTIYLTGDDTVMAEIYTANDKLEKKLNLRVDGDDIDADIMTYGNEIKLKQGQYIMIYAPVSMIYKVQEVIPAEEGYSIDAKYTENGTFNTVTKDVNKTETVETKTYEALYNPFDTEEFQTVFNGNLAIISKYTNNDESMVGLCVRGTTNTDMDLITFTNKREAGAVTGINLDIIPYVAILILAVAGCAVFIVRKSRKAR